MQRAVRVVRLEPPCLAIAAPDLNTRVEWPDRLLALRLVRNPPPSFDTLSPGHSYRRNRRTVTAFLGPPQLAASFICTDLHSGPFPSPLVPFEFSGGLISRIITRPCRSDSHSNANGVAMTASSGSTSQSSMPLGGVSAACICDVIVRIERRIG
jgi:hypothetical protein